jgi:hypothetical protein
MKDTTDFLSALLQPAAPIPKQLTYKGQTGTVFFRRITAGERASLLKGQKITRHSGEESTIEVDLGETTIGKARLVLFSSITEEGKQRFTSLNEVQRAENTLIEALYELASQVNEEEEDEAGKA